MDDWHSKLARDLMAETPSGAVFDAGASMEIAFGQARSAITYALELARAHRLPATGRVEGDEVWLRFGHGQGSLTLNRREGYIAVEVHLPGPPVARREQQLRWHDRGFVDDSGGPADPGAITRTLIDELVADWRSRPESERGRLSSAPPPDLDDEPTKA